MKRSVRLLILSAAILVSLALPQGCSTANPDNSSREEDASVSGSIPLTGEPTPYPDPDPVPAIDEDPQDEEALIEAILLTYGAEYAGQGNRLRPQTVSLYYAGEWNSIEELGTSAYFSWMLGWLWHQNFTDEELEQFSAPDGRELGWYFPQEQFEQTVQRHFAVSTEALRADELVYHAEDEAYWIGTGGGRGMTPSIELAESRTDGDLLLLSVDLVYDEDYEPDAHWLLTVRLEEDGGWKYESWTERD